MIAPIPEIRSELYVITPGKLGAKWSRKVHFLRGFYAVFNLPALYDFPVTPQY